MVHYDVAVPQLSVFSQHLSGKGAVYTLATCSVLCYVAAMANSLSAERQNLTRLMKKMVPGDVDGHI